MSATLLESPPKTVIPATPSLSHSVPDFNRIENAPAWFADRSRSAWKDFQTLPVPGIKHEAWRYSNAKNLSLDEFVPAAEATTAASKRAAEQSSGIADASARLVFVNDQLVHQDTARLPAGAVCLPLDEALRSHGDLLAKHFMRRESFIGSAKFAALHLAHVRAGTVVFVPRNVHVEHPIEIFHWVADANAAIFPHTLVITEDHAEVAVVDHFRSLGHEGGLSIGVTDLIAGKASRIRYIACQEMGDQGQCLHLSSTAAHRDANVKSFSLQLGARFSRTESVSDLVGEGSRSDMLSVSLPVGDQIVDQRTLQNHKAAHAASDLLYKNALYDKSRTIFSGLITVDEGAHYTDAYQKCRNLLNSDEAEASSLPGLEINADQVKCSHGSTSSPVSDDELFYLKARGISDADSRKLIVFGFINDAISRIGDDSIESMIRDRVEEKFARVA